MYSFSTKGIRSKRIFIKANGLRIPLLILKPMTEPVNAPGVIFLCSILTPQPYWIAMPRFCL
jgi:hypothetical protein